MKRIRTWCLLLILLLACMPGRAWGETEPPGIEDAELSGEDGFICRFDGVKHRVLLALPETPEGAPLVLLLPGYGNTAEAFRTQTHFEQEANARGYAVAYVTGAPDPNVPTSSVGWHAELDTPGNRDLAFLIALKDCLQETWALDRTRAFAVGFSNGALMAHCLAMEAGESFTACVSVAGYMPKSVWEARGESAAVGFFQITGEKDDAVPQNRNGSARFARAPAIEDAMAYWVSANGLEERETVTVGRDAVLTKYAGEGSRRQVWDLLLPNGRHSWPSRNIHQFDVNALILDFFDAQG